VSDIFTTSDALIALLLGFPDFVNPSYDYDYTTTATSQFTPFLSFREHVLLSLVSKEVG